MYWNVSDDNKINFVQVTHRRLAAQLCGIFATKENTQFERRLQLLLPVVLNQFAEGFIETAPGHILRTYDESTITFHERLHDHHLYQVQNMLIKICNSCPKFLNDHKYTEQVETLAGNSHWNHLFYSFNFKYRYTDEV